MRRKMIILTEGFTNPHVGKTARNVIRYIPQEVCAILDKTEAGNRIADLLGVESSVPIVGSLDDAPEADTLLIGVATPGGILPDKWKLIILDAIARGMDIISGLHENLVDDEEIRSAAEKKNVRLFDIRRTNEKVVVHRKGINEKCLRIHTVGNDCSLGKMIVSVELNKELTERGYDSKFVATGQTGIIIEGGGIPIDAVKGDYINGAAEKLVLQNQHHDIIIIEGQGSLVHPRYSSVTLGLLHGSMPHGLIMCYEMGREYIANMENVKIPPMERVMELFLDMANIMHPCEIIGIAINSRKYSKAEADRERETMRRKFGLPACDVVRHGAGDLADAVINFRSKLGI